VACCVAKARSLDAVGLVMLAGVEAICCFGEVLVMLMPMLLLRFRLLAGGGYSQARSLASHRLQGLPLEQRTRPEIHSLHALCACETAGASATSGLWHCACR
jgi:hypothetical protein